MARLMRKSLRKILEGKETSVTITPENLGDYAGVRKFRHGMSEDEPEVGAVTGLAWTEVGGELLTIEVTMPIPALGPSLGTAPSGRWIWMSLRAISEGLIP